MNIYTLRGQPHLQTDPMQKFENHVSIDECDIFTPMIQVHARNRCTHSNPSPFVSLETSNA
jgi:hypothetical protein